MTKEELYHELNCYLERQIDNSAIGDLDYIVDEFFSQNVVIPKGKNRHPYADVLHEWIEGAEVEFTHDEGADAWKLFSTNSIEKFRIKPQEPVYEWQWYDMDRNNEVFMANSGKFMTEDEAGKLTSYGFMRKFEETKRVRNEKH